MKSIETAIRNNPFFHGLDENYLDFIIRSAVNARFKAGDYVFREGENADKFFVIVEGKMHLGAFKPDGSETVIMSPSSADIVGWSWLIPPFRWHIDAKVSEETKLVVINAKSIRAKFSEDTRLGYELLRRFFPIMEQRLNAAYFQAFQPFKNLNS
ncbi:MAG: hypothetical protein A3K03_00170 [Bdellovibrionales bacterium RIFOXYD1_FULL_44_7]|nr:MAG: hypothetical protein A3K03_00170 [Bdellovibrionales bacterium RIFOXYD1_FULL_44_7]